MRSFWALSKSVEFHPCVSAQVSLVMTHAGRYYDVAVADLEYETVSLVNPEAPRDYGADDFALGTRPPKTRKPRKRG